MAGGRAVVQVPGLVVVLLGGLVQLTHGCRDAKRSCCARCRNVVSKAEMATGRKMLHGSV